MRNRFRSQKRILLGCVIMLLVLLTSVEGYRWAYPKISEKTLTGSIIRLFPNDSYKYYLNDAEVLSGSMGGLYAPTGENPLMMFVFDDPLEVNSLRIAFRQPLETDTVIEAYSVVKNESGEVESFDNGNYICGFDRI